jgi:hypothetical protein
MDLLTCVLALMGLAVLLITAIIQVIKTKKAGWTVCMIVVAVLMVLLAVYAAATL